jgi:N-acyl-phosphatidylethanolamine-hydrolysing phospholipase D
MPLSDLPKIDFVLISHNHYDHLDAKTVKYLRAFQPQIQWIVPLRLSRWFRDRNVLNVSELDWWQSFQGKDLKITAVPAQHFSGRTLWDQNKTYWNGYVCEIGDKRFYFTGDTGYNSIDFKQIGNRWPHMDLSMIPIGTYAPREFMKPVHCGPWEAVDIHLDVKSRFSIGMHWNTFNLSEEPEERPPYDLYLTMTEKKLPYETFLPLSPGLQANW